MDIVLVMFKSDGQRKDFPLDSPVTVVGRNESCDLRAPILSVSRRHCELSVSGDRLSVKDLGSSNGTYVNNERITEAELKPGDRLAVGPIIFTIQVDGAPAEIQPVKTRGQQLAEAGDTSVEEVVNLEADVVAQPGASAPGTPDEAAQAAGTPKPKAKPEAKPVTTAEDSDDVIAALEALAAESEDEEEDKPQDK